MKRLAVFLVALAAAVALAGIYLPSDAATVGKAAITRQSLDSDLSAIAGSPDYTCFLAQERALSSGAPVPLLGAGTASARGGVYSTTFVDDWLGSMITDDVAAHVDKSEDLAVSAADLSTARAVLEHRMTSVLDQYARDVGAATPGCGGSGLVVLASLPSWFVSAQVLAEADQAVLDARVAGASLSSGGVAGYFYRHRTTFDRACLSIIVVKQRATASKVEGALAAGASFSHEAVTASVTSATAADGGTAGCGVLAGTFLAPEVDALRTGGLSAPIRAEGVYWIVQLDSRSPEPLASVRTTVITALLDKGQARADALLARALKRTAVSVDPRYGAASARRLTLVVPPTSPPAGASISVSANTPVLTAASS